MTIPVGNSHVRDLLIRTIDSGKISHAYIFSGIDGIGKKFFAQEFAMKLNCLAEDSRPCGSCINCSKIQKGIHPDLTVISTDKKMLKLEDVKQILALSYTRPFEGRYKIVIIDDAHKMNMFASNALLKTLEEPSSSSVIILVTSNPNNLLMTIQSRCVKINFSPLSDPELKTILGAMDHKETAIDTVLPLAGGSAMQALNYLEQETYEDIITINDLVSNIQKMSFAEMCLFAERIIQKNTETIFFNVLLQYHAHKIRSVMRAENSAQNRELFGLLSGYQKIVKFNRFLRYNINKAFLIESLLIALKGVNKS